MACPEVGTGFLLNDGMEFLLVKITVSMNMVCPFDPLNEPLSILYRPLPRDAFSLHGGFGFRNLTFRGSDLSFEGALEN